MEVMTRKEAIAKGLTTYFTGKPCVKGHVAKRNTSGSGCVSCKQEYQKKYRKTPEYRRAARQQKKRAYAANREMYRDHNRKSRYCLVPGAYRDMLEKQNGLCAICQQSACANGRGFHVDHDHRCCPHNGKSCGRCVRGLLCDKCNTGLGKFMDNVSYLRNAILYLEKYGG